MALNPQNAIQNSPKTIFISKLISSTVIFPEVTGISFLLSPANFYIMQSVLGDEKSCNHHSYTTFRCNRWEYVVCSVH